MKRIIDIPDETYEYWKEHSHEYVLAEAIKNSVPLDEELKQLKDEIQEKGFNSPYMNPLFAMTEILEMIDRHIEK